MPTRLKKSIRSSVLLSEESHARVNELAVANDVSAAWVIRHAVTEFLKSHSDQSTLPLQPPKMAKTAGARHV
jgi:hypothetical protein